MTPSTQPEAGETVELEPCPFCGHEAEFERKGTPRFSTIIVCTWCGARLETGEEWDHGRVWNRRVPAQSERDSRDRRFTEHTAAVGDFLRDLLSVYYPCADVPVLNIKDACELLLSHAEHDRQFANQQANRISELESALRPFIRDLPNWSETKPDHHIAEFWLSLGQLRKARSALTPGEKS